MVQSTSLKLLATKARLAAPRVVRTVYRIARHLSERPQPSRPLPQEQVDGCQVCASRERLIDWLPKGGRVAELGTYRGLFAREILKRSQPRELHLVDIDLALLDETVRTGPGVTCHQGLTDAVIATFPDGYFDWIYIDADHSYGGVVRDARASAAKVRPGGLLVFNDFGHVDQYLGRYGVHRAVTDFALESGWKLRYLALSGNALYDVALEKPSP